MEVTLSPDPGGTPTVYFQVDGLTIDTSVVAASGLATFSIPTVVADNNRIFDATLQVGANTAVEASVQVVETNAAQTVGVTLSSTDVTYCSPLGGGGGTGTVTSVATGTGLTGGTITTTGTIVHQVQPVSGTGPAFVKSVEIDTLGHVSTVVGESTAGAYRTATGTDDASNLTTGTIPDARLSIASAYTGQIETAAVKTYTIDPSAVHARTVTAFYARSGAGTCTATLKNAAATVGTVSVTTSSGLAASIANASVLVDGLITVVVSSNSAATDVVFAVEYTQ